MTLFADVFGIVLLALVVLAILCWVHGIVLAFSASIWLGIVCTFLAVPFLVFGLVYWVAGVDLAQWIVDALRRRFG